MGCPIVVLKIASGIHDFLSKVSLFYSKTVTESSNLNFSGVDPVDRIFTNISPYVPLISANKMLPFFHSFPSEKPLCPGVLCQIMRDPSFEIVGECMKAAA